MGLTAPSQALSRCRWRRRGRHPAGAASLVVQSGEDDVTLAGLVAEVHAHSRQTYGSRRVTAALHASGYPVSRRLVRALMRAQGLKACQPRPWRRTTLPGDTPAAVPDRVNRDFTAAEPNLLWLVDFT